MMTFVCRGSGFAQHLKSVSQSVGGRHVGQPLPSYLNGNLISQRTVEMEEHDHEHDWPEIVPYNEENTLKYAHHLVPPTPLKLTYDSLNKTLIRRQLIFGSGIGVGHQMRYAHTDIKVPDFSQYRRPSTRDPTKRNEESVDSRRVFTYAFTAVTGAAVVIAAKSFTHSLVGMLAPAKDALALDKIEVDIGKIPEGKNVTVKWRGKPVFIRHRSADEIAKERAVDISQLRDPQKDEDRSESGEWLILIGICTHLGCVPIPNQGDYGGYYCPCHGSHYDASGRIRKGPAPLNLEVPVYTITGTTLVVG